MGMLGINTGSRAEQNKEPDTLDRIFKGVELASRILGTGVDAYTGIKNANTAKESSDLNKIKVSGDIATNLRPAANPAEEAQGMPIEGMAGKFVNRERPESAIDILAKSLTVQKSKTEGEKSALELGKMKKEQAMGRNLSDNEIKNLAEGANIPGMLNDIHKTVQENADYFGPASGRIAGANPYDTKAQLIQSKMATGAQLIGKYMEGGVLRAEDVPKYQKMLPQLNDTPEVARGKAAAVQKMIRDRFNLTKNALKDSGFNTEAFDKSPLNELPDPFEKKQDKAAYSQDVLTYADKHHLSPALAYEDLKKKGYVK